MEEDLIGQIYDGIDSLQQVGDKNQFIEAMKDPKLRQSIYEGTPALQEVGSLDQFLALGGSPEQTSTPAPEATTTPSRSEIFMGLEKSKVLTPQFHQDLEDQQRLTDAQFGVTGKGSGITGWLNRRKVGAINAVLSISEDIAGLIELGDRKLGNEETAAYWRERREVVHAQKLMNQAAIPTAFKGEAVTERVDAFLGDDGKINTEGKGRKIQVEVNREGKFEEIRDEQNKVVHNVSAETIESFNQSDIGKDFSTSLSVKNALSNSEQAIYDIGAMMLGGKGVGAAAQGITKGTIKKGTQRALMTGYAGTAAATQSFSDNYAAALTKTNGDVDKAMNMAAMQSAATGILTVAIGKLDVDLVGGTDKVANLIKQKASDFAAGNITRAALVKDFTIALTKDTAGETFEEVLDVVASNAIENYNGFDKALLTTDEFLETAASTVFTTAPFAAYNNNSRLNKEGIVATSVYSAAKDADGFAETMDELVAEYNADTNRTDAEKITFAEEAKQKKLLVQEVHDNLNQIDDLDQNQEVALTALLVQKRNMKRGISKVTDESIQQRQQAKLDAVTAEIDRILDGEETGTSAENAQVEEDSSPQPPPEGENIVQATDSEVKNNEIDDSNGVTTEPNTLIEEQGDITNNDDVNQIESTDANSSFEGAGLSSRKKTSSIEGGVTANQNTPTELENSTEQSPPLEGAGGRNTLTTTNSDITNKKVFSDWDETLYDNKNQQLTPLGEEIKGKIADGTLKPEDLEILTANTRPGIASEIAQQLGIPVEAIKTGLTPEQKGQIVDSYTGDKIFIDDNPDNRNAATTGEIIDPTNSVDAIPNADVPDTTNTEQDGVVAEDFDPFSEVPDSAGIAADKKLAPKNNIERANDLSPENWQDDVAIAVAEGQLKLNEKDFDEQFDPNVRKDRGIALGRLLDKNNNQGGLDVLAEELADKWGGDPLQIQEELVRFISETKFEDYFKGRLATQKGRDLRRYFTPEEIAAMEAVELAENLRKADEAMSDMTEESVDELANFIDENYTDENGDIDFEGLATDLDGFDNFEPEFLEKFSGLSNAALNKVFSVMTTPRPQTEQIQKLEEQLADAKNEVQTARETLAEARKAAEGLGDDKQKNSTLAPLKQALSAALGKAKGIKSKLDDTVNKTEKKLANELKNNGRQDKSKAKPKAEQPRDSAQDPSESSENQAATKSPTTESSTTNSVNPPTPPVPPKDPTPTDSTTNPDDDFVAAKNAFMDELRKDVLDKDAVKANPTTVERMVEEALEKGYVSEGLDGTFTNENIIADQVIEANVIPNDGQIIAMGMAIGKLKKQLTGHKAAWQKAREGNRQADERKLIEAIENAENNIDKLTRALRIAGNLTAKALMIRKELLSFDKYSAENMRISFEALYGKKLTADQKADIQKAADAIAAKDAIIEKMRQELATAKDTAAQLEANKIIKKVQSRSKDGKRKRLSRKETRANLKGILKDPCA